MPKNAEASTGKRFAQDMRRIRQRRGVSINEIVQATRIAPDLIEAFEQTGLFDHPSFHRIYLRVFVREYARCVQIDPELALHALEAALENRYANELEADNLDKLQDNLDDLKESLKNGLDADPVD